MIWACSAAAGIHLAAVLALGAFSGSPGAGGVVSPQTVSVRYLANTPDATTAGNTAQEDASNTGRGPDPTAQTAVASASAVGAGGAEPRQYFDVSEVDEPANPVPDWSLDPEFLVRNGVRSLKVEVLISDAGRPERCTVASMTPARRALYSVIEQQLCQTRLTPAMRKGVAVPSVRHVEIMLSQD